MRRWLHSSRILCSESSIKAVSRKSPVGEWRAPSDGSSQSDARVKLAQASQSLRRKLAEKSDASLELAKFGSVLLETPTSGLPQHVNLISQALERNSRTNVEDLQLLFRAVASSSITGSSSLATKLYLDIFHNAKLSAEDRLLNGILFYEMLIRQGMVDEARQLLPALLKDNKSAINEQILLTIIDSTVAVKPDARSLRLAVEAMRENASPAIVQKAVELLRNPDLHLPGASLELGHLVNHLYFDNPHYLLDKSTLIIALDSLLELYTIENEHNQEIGKKLLKLAIPQLLQTGRLEDAELLLLCVIRFRDSVSVGKMIVDTMRQRYAETDLVKESWDILAQWEIYSSNSLENLKAIIDKMAANGIVPNPSTLSSLLVVASENARLSETNISEIVEYFNEELGIVSNAAAFYVLMKRALAAVEVETARSLFLDSCNAGADWNMENGRYLPVLSELLYSLCNSTAVSTETIVDTYKRIRAFTTTVSYAAQVSILQKLLDTKDLHEISLFLVQQFSETPNLIYDDYRQIYDAFYSQIISSGNFEQSWDLYGILNSTMNLPYESYYPIMLHFCDIARPDGAHLMFRHMRNRAKREGLKPPGREIYLMLFAQYAKYRYEEGIQELEVYFRMDLNNEMDVEIMNHMMLAFTGLQQVPKVSNLWLELQSFPLGLGANNETIDIMLSFLTQQLSLDAVDDLWQVFPEQFQLKPSHENVKRYVIANCYHGHYMRALQIVQAAPELYGVDITAELLESVYNWTMLESRKLQVEEYALEHHPEKWQQLVENKRLKNIVLPADLEPHMELSLRNETIAQIEASEPQVPQITLRTDDYLYK